MIFKIGEKITKNNKSLLIKKLLGDGGQGEVYLVNDGQKDLALKIYTYEPSADFVYNLKNNIYKGKPSNDFLWPLSFIEIDDGHIGYLMELRPEKYKSFISYLNGKTVFKSLRVMLDWCIHLVNAFKRLHERGYSYQDLNDGSFFLDPENGSLLICDNDNVSANKTNLGILGKMRYMAPEIVRRDIDPLTKEPFLPDTHSDRFSLAIILFMTLCLGNPFEGECLKKYTIINEKAEHEIYGNKPVYVFNNQDTSNRPIRGYHTAVLNRYPHLPSYIKEAFHRTFVDGLNDRENGRTTELEWIRLLCKYRDELLGCSCGKEYAYGFSEKKAHTKCPFCKKETKRFCFLEIGKNRIALQPGKRIYRIHIDKYSCEYTEVIGQVIQNKNNPAIWGIRLNLDNDVLIKDNSGNEKKINSKGVIPIINSLTIKFEDRVSGQIIMKEGK